MMKYVRIARGRVRMLVRAVVGEMVGIMVLLMKFCFRKAKELVYAKEAIK